MRYGRHLILLICLGASVGASLLAQSPLQVEREGDHLRLSAIRLQLLEGKPLEQLHNGASVTYVFELTLAPDEKSAPVLRLKERFIFSYDLWEEKFSVVQAGSSGRSASQMTAAMAVAWCMDNMRVTLPAFSPEKTFMLKLECWTAGNEGESGSDNGTALTLAGLVDVFSRKSRNPPPHWLAVTGPLRLMDLKEKKKPKT